jgi:hypothetical protein
MQKAGVPLKAWANIGARTGRTLVATLVGGFFEEFVDEGLDFLAAMLGRWGRSRGAVRNLRLMCIEVVVFRSEHD